MNLLPIPVLDGGLILFSLIAMIFRRRLPEKFIAVVSTVFMYLLMGLMLFLVARDFWRIGTGTLQKKVEFGEVREVPSLKPVTAGDAAESDVQKK